MYQSPIDVIMGQMHMTFENEICKAVQNVGVNVDKEELLKALQYDRGQYQVGFEEGHIDGYNQAMSEMPDIVRCKDCVRRGNPRMCIVAKYAEQKGTPYFVVDNRGEWFCADGKRTEA